ncbi:hypothetical protein F4553_007182 [Allocatelliglobosispora scoriae]|uniref:Uncharacterized protein n=1 Tax=Allocatelliglobosispora scoriae TaxID=643052 RepID=A0A841C1W7_9ACTN|nr:hypothetical protein [Allocatelliglobosispora scoriae]MBB5873748.1 hypothetical protein [Allocatelliglobosispora scoriae]
MLKRLAQLVTLAPTATVGVFVFATPALAVGGCTPSSILSPCVDWGAGADNIRADFYLDTAPSNNRYYYRVAIHVIRGSDDNGMWVSAKTRFTTTGHYCCWYRYWPLGHPPVEPAKMKTVIYIYNSASVLYEVRSSPIVTFP